MTIHFSQHTTSSVAITVGSKISLPLSLLGLLHLYFCGFKRLLKSVFIKNVFLLLWLFQLRYKGKLTAGPTENWVASVLVHALAKAAEMLL